MSKSWISSLYMELLEKEHSKLKLCRSRISSLYEVLLEGWKEKPGLSKPLKHYNDPMSHKWEKQMLRDGVKLGQCLKMVLKDILQHTSNDGVRL